MRTLCVPFLLALFVVRPSLAAEKTAAQWLPPSTIVYAELTQPKQLLDGVLNHAIRKKIESLDIYKQLLAQPNYKQAITVIRFVEFQLGMKWQQAVTKLTAGGIYLGYDADTNGLALFLKTESEASLNKLKSAFLKLARANNKKALPEKKYRGVTAYGLEKAVLATVDNWVMVVNKNELGKKVIDLYKDGGNSLANNERFKKARASVSQTPTVWAYTDMKALRKAAGKDAFNGKADNAGAEILLGGILDTLKNTPFVTSSFYFSANKLRLNLSVPHKASWVSEAREYFFGKGGQGRAPAILPARNKLLTIAAYRDFSQMWLRASDLFDKGTNEELAKADSTLSVLFSGRDFGEDILGAFHPGMQIILTRQDFSKAKVKPAIRLPAGALIMRLKNAKKKTGELRRIFQSLVGFLNVVGAMEGQPQLDLDIDKKDGVQIVSATYVPDDDEDKNKARINFNFSPSIAFAGERVILSSSKALAEELATAKAQKPPKGKVVNVESVTYFKAIKDALNDNRGQLIAQTMLSDGKNRREAAAQVDLILSAIGMFKDASLQLFTTKNSLQVDMQLRINK